MKPLALIILDGWGYREAKDNNAIALANTPNWDALWQQYAHTLISSSGLDVGLPTGQMGNSEVGHLHMGAGRLVPQDLVRIDQAIDSGEFSNNETLLHALHTAKKNNKAVHILGLLSPGGVHSHERHIYALINMAAKQHGSKVYLHAILDGRDTPPRSALASLAQADKLFHETQCGRIASICGRYYAMDRDKRWERIQLAYDMYTSGVSKFTAATAAQGLEAAYERDENDEFVNPTVIGNEPALIEDGDVVIFMNFRADRARQLSHALVDEKFNGFNRKKMPKLGDYVTLTKYANDIQAHVVYPPMKLDNVFGAYIAKQGLKQLRIAETEKYAHVTFFFNGGREDSFDGEDRILVPSPKVATYDLQPEMSAHELTDKLVTAIASEKYDAIICNYANADMVGHSGNLKATIKAIETIDSCLGQIVAALKKVGGEALITADHGNAEFMYDELKQQPHTAHTTNPIPLLYIGRPARINHEHGSLVDIAPTMCELLGLKQPKEMTGTPIFKVES